ncbi:MAG: patatin-like phospholipase family protein [Thermoanaerobaculia bacterium]
MTDAIPNPEPAGSSIPSAVGSSAKLSAMTLTGGGARGAYQVGFLRCLARNIPEERLDFQLLTGVSAGAINTAYLAARKGSFAAAVEDLVSLWSGLTFDRVFRVDAACLARNVLRWGLRLVSGGAPAAPSVRGLLDTTPLRQLLSETLRPTNGVIEEIDANLSQGRVRAVALTSLNYSTGQTVTWIQGCELDSWERANRRGIKTRITVDHVMASAALPLIFPAVELEGGWYGDGAIRMYTPLAPAIHLGADAILAISTRYPRSRDEASQPVISGYPPPAQVAGVLLNAIFLDAIEQDAYRLERINRLLGLIPSHQSRDLRPVRLLTPRPSRDLGRLAADYESKLPRAFRFLTRGLGTRETSSPDFLSLLMFQPDYLRQLIEIGEADAEDYLDEIHQLLE